MSSTMPGVAAAAPTRSAIIWVLLAVAIAFNAAGQLLLKRAAMAGGAVGAIQRAFLSPWFLVGVSSLGLSMLLWVQVLRKVPLTIAHPLTGTVFVIVPLASHYLWGEPLPPTRVLGVLVILAGMVLVARGG
jgi:undecaprenyl phosphate-alpha-L-ara4N flippase subunit ArnE